MSVQHAKNKPLILGLTGGIATGKSTASEYFEQLGIPVIDSDLIVKELWLHHQEMLEQIESTFHTLDKKKIATIIFSDKKSRQLLNQIVHPYVFITIQDILKSFKDERMIVIDMPLLFEAGYEDQVDVTAVVYTDLYTAKARVMERDHLSKKDAELRINAQLPIEEKCRLADYILDNTCDEKKLYRDIDQMLRSILNEE